MILGFFLVFSRSVEERFSLLPPHELTNVSEIGNWTIRGHTSNLKSFLRLTSSIPNQYGGVCQRVPTMFRDWSVDLDIQAHSGDGGKGIWFYFTNEVCPDLPLVYEGFTIWINTTEKNVKGESPVFFAANNGSILDFAKIAPSGHIKLLGNNGILTITITRENSKVTLKEGKRVIFTQEVRDLIKFGYFTVAAVTSATSNNHDLYSIRTFALSLYEQNEFQFDISAKNRKIIEDEVLRRRFRKNLRRAKMMVTKYYMKQIEAAKSKLNGDNAVIVDAFSLINEADSRAQDTVTVESLSRYIENFIDATIEKAQNKINLAFEKFDETKLDMNEMWSDLRTKLLGLSMETKSSMAILERDIMTSAKSMKLENLNTKGLGQSLETESSHISVSPISKSFVIISIAELIAYVIFFIYKHKKTKGFKID